MRKFYLCYPGGVEECEELSRSHVCELIYIRVRHFSVLSLVRLKEKMQMKSRDCR